MDTNFNPEINLVFDQVNIYSCKKNKKTTDSINYYITTLSNKIIDNIVTKNKKIKLNHIKTAVNNTMTDADVLREHCEDNGTKAIAKFAIYDAFAKKEKVPDTHKTGLIFKIEKVKSIVEDKIKKTIDTDALVYMTMVLEYVTAEIIEQSCILAQKEKKVLITPSLITKAIDSDDELFIVLK